MSGNTMVVGQDQCRCEVCNRVRSGVRLCYRLDENLRPTRVRACQPCRARVHLKAVNFERTGYNQ